MKRLLLLLLCLLLFSNIAMATPATPTDLDWPTDFEKIQEIFNDDYGYIEDIGRDAFLHWIGDIDFYMRDLTLVSIWMNFSIKNIYDFDWEYDENEDEIWFVIDDAYEGTRTFILVYNNNAQWWRVELNKQEE